MDQLKTDVNWPEELRKFVETKIKEIKAKKRKKIVKKLESANWSVLMFFLLKLLGRL